MKKRLFQSTIEKLDYYVYALIDPRTKKAFYIGKGKGSRIYAHVEASEAVYEDGAFRLLGPEDISGLRTDSRLIN